jgi:hypothetical protein
MQFRPFGGGGCLDLGQNGWLKYFTMGVIWIQTSGGMAPRFIWSLLWSKQEMVMGVWVRMHQKLLSVGLRRDERALDVNLIGVLAWDGRKCVPEGRDVVLNIIYVPEVKGSDLLPQQGVGPNGHGSAVGEVACRRFHRAGTGFWGPDVGIELAKHEGADAFLGA